MMEITEDSCKEILDRAFDDHSTHIIYGESVHRNEFGIDKGIFISPDKMRFAFYRNNQSAVTDYPTGPYPMAGQPSEMVNIGIFTQKGQTPMCNFTDKVIWLDLGDPTDRYFTNIQWSPDSKRLYLYEVNRAQTDTSLDEYDAETGLKIRTLYTEHDDRYVEPQHPIEFLPWDPTQYISWSRKDGFWHQYLGSRQLTQGDWEVLDLLRFEDETRSVIIACNKLSPLRNDTFKVNIETGEMTYVGPTVPKETEPTEDEKLADEYAEGLTFEHGTIKAADGVTDLYYRLILPPSLKGGHNTEVKANATDGKIPAIVYVYGGPHVQLVQEKKYWGAKAVELQLAQAGFAVFAIDPRGSDNRGKAFEQACWHELGQVQMQDVLKGIEFLKALPYINKERLGIHGWSFGGFMTLTLILSHPDIFKCAVAGGAVTDWRFYEVMYGERYMGTPQNNPEGYVKTSVIDKADRLSCPLFMIHGGKDDVVLTKHLDAFLTACKKAGKSPEVFIYPDEKHNMKGENKKDLNNKIVDYFANRL